MNTTKHDMAEALRLLKEGGRKNFSIDYLQRKMSIGFQSAWELMHALEDAGMVRKTTEQRWKWEVST